MWQKLASSYRQIADSPVAATQVVLPLPPPPPEVRHTSLSASRPSSCRKLCRTDRMDPGWAEC